MYLRRILSDGAAASVAATFILVGAAHASENAPPEEERALVAENIQQADANEDGALDREEFETFVDLSAEDGIGRTDMIRRMGLYGRAFGRIDADDDGVISLEELAAMAEQSNGE